VRPFQPWRVGRSAIAWHFLRGFLRHFLGIDFSPP
jgi:hypothetical protein